MKDKTHKAETIIKKWHDYEGNIVKARKPYENAIKKKPHASKYD